MKDVAQQIADHIDSDIIKELELQVMDLEDKFMVMNRKRFEEMLDKDYWVALPYISKLENALYELEQCYEQLTGKKMDQQYMIINCDESYAETVKKIILENSK